MRIAISGHSGCGNSTATSNVGKALSLSVMNYTFRDLAKDLGISFEQLHAEATTNYIYDYLTDLKCVRAALTEKVVVGTRLAAWLTNADLKIWLNASLDARAERINRREAAKGNSYEETLFKTLKRDQDNRRRYLQLYGIDMNDHQDFDVIINTERLTAEQVSSLIVAAAHWASENKLVKKNLHLERIRGIIAEKLQMPLKALTDPSFVVDVKEIYKKLSS